MKHWLVPTLLFMAWLSLAGCMADMPQVTPLPATSLPATTTFSPQPTHTATFIATDAPPPPRTIEVSADEVRGAILHFWHPWSGEVGEVIRQQVDEFNLSNPWNIIVVPESQASFDRLDEGLQAALAAGESVDVAVGFPYQSQVWGALQPLVDLQPYAQDAQWGLSQDELTDFYPAFWEQDVSDGQRLGIPAQRIAQVLFYNTSWARELGFDKPPASLETFSRQACTAARDNLTDSEPENDGSGGWIASSDYAATLSWIYSAGGDVLHSPEPGADQSAYQFDTPLVEEIFTSFKSLYDLGCIWIADTSNPAGEFASRRGLFATGSVMDIPYQAEAFGQAGGRDAWTVIPYPSAVASPTAAVYGPSYNVFASSPQRQLAAWLFVKWMILPQNHARFVEASGSFPLRQAELSYLTGYQNRYPQWKAALDLIPSARGEPGLPSWGKVRWALTDAVTQLFRSYFQAEQIPATLRYLEQTAADLHLGMDLQQLFSTPTP